MGAWGNGSFDNDDAADFLADFLADVTDSSDLALIGEIFATVLGAEEYLEAPDASQAIAAAEIVAAAAGRATPAALEEEELSEWLARVKPAVDPSLVQQAVQVLDRVIGENSELRELWEEADELSDWEATVVALRSQLQV
ncbi:DUF4259 domain-containing protein [Luteimonas sp. A537]